MPLIIYLSLSHHEHTHLYVTQSDSAGYDPRRSRVSDDTMMDFVRGNITGDLTEVPGIGPKTAEKLAISADGDDNDQITNTYQLFGKFLMLKGPDTDGEKVECMEHCEKFWYWLQSKGVTAHRSAVVKAVAQKINGIMPGVYDPSLYEDDDEDEE